MKRTLVALALVALFAAVVIAHGMWQAKKYDGTTLGLYSAAGDSSRFYRAHIDTAETDTLYGRRAHLLRAWIDTLEGDSIHYERASFDTLYGTGLVDLSHVHIDTLSVDSLTVANAHFDTLTADTLFSTHLQGSVADVDQLYTDYIGADDAPVTRAYIDTLFIPGMGLAGEPQWSVGDWWDRLHSAGRITGGAVTDAGSGNVDVAGGTGLFRIADDDTSQVVFADWADSAGIAIPTGTVRYLGVSYNAGDPQVTLFTTESWDLDTSFPLAKVVNEGDLHILNNPWWVGDGLTNVIERFQAMGHVVRDLEVGGLTLGTAGTRNVTVTEGLLWSRLNEFPVEAFDSSAGDTLELYYRSGASTWTDADTLQFPVGHYNRLSDNSLQALGTGKYANVWVYVETEDDEITMLYPQAEYSNAAQAEAEAPPSSIPLHIQQNGLLIGRILIKRATDSPVKVESAWTTTFSPSQAADHGNLAGLTDNDHPQYLQAVDFDDSLYAQLDTAALADQWQADIAESLAAAGAGDMMAADVRDSILAAYGDTLHTSVHDTANALRSELQGVGYNGKWDSLTTKTVDSASLSMWLQDGYMYLAAGAGGVVSYSIAAGQLTKVDSVGGIPIGDVWSDGSYVYATNFAHTMYCLSTSAGDLTLVDSLTTLTAHQRSMHGAVRGDSVYIFTGDDAGYEEVVTAKAGDLTWKSRKAGSVGATGYSTWATTNGDSIFVYGSHGGGGTYVWSCDVAGTLTQVDNEATGGCFHYGVWGNDSYLFVGDGDGGVRGYTRNPTTGLLTAAGTITDFSTNHQNIYMYGSYLYLTGLPSYPPSLAVTVYQATYSTAPTATAFDTQGPFGDRAHIEKSIFSDGTYLYLLAGGKIITFDQEQASALSGGVYNIYAPFRANNTSLFAGNVSIDVDGTPTDKAYNLSVYNGAAYSRLDAAADWTLSSSRDLKTLDPPFTPTLGARVLDAIANLPLQTWYFREDSLASPDRAQRALVQHVGPTAEDWYAVSKLLRPKEASPDQIAGEDKTAALLIAVQELDRRDRAQESEIADLRKRVQGLESTPSNN